VRSDAQPCDEVAEALPCLLDGTQRADRSVVRHVGSCLRCQAEMAKYRGMLRLLEQLRAQHPPLPPGALGSVLAAIEERAGQEVARSALLGRRAALVSAGALAAMGTAAAVALVAARGRSARAARLS
jgi:hypothetical protein